MSNKSKQFFDDDGKPISKNAYKKLLKLKSKSQKTKEKAIINDKTKVTPEEYYSDRLKMIDEMFKQGLNPYPHKYDTIHNNKDISSSIPQFIENFKKLKNGECDASEIKCLMGRIKLIRNHGSCLYFFVIEGDDSEIQLLLNKRLFSSENDFFKAIRLLKRGDIIGAKGHPGKTKTGELSLYVQSIQILTPCLHPLPSFKYGFKDQEQRYRQRHLDLILNPAKRRIFYTRSKIVSYIRRFLDERGFLEVETPMLSIQPGGANARPFATHHNDLGLPMFLRVAPELHLKRLVVGGLNRVYEIGRQFRNEGIDLTHNPEFTTCEFYWAFKDHEDLIRETEEMVSGMVESINGSSSLKFTDKDGNSVLIDFSPPFLKIDYIAAIEEAAGFKIPRPIDSEATKRFLLGNWPEDLAVPQPPSTARLLDKLSDHFVESRLVQPTFIVNHPAVVSPLAKTHREHPELTERFELFVCGKELCNSFTELNDPAEQRERFAAQARGKSEGDDECMELDEDFLSALETGLPPTAGWGFGIDRFAMFMTDSYNIKEVLLFPAMRPEEKTIKNK